MCNCNGTDETIKFYSDAIEKRNDVFSSKISNIAYDVENLDEEARQEKIMYDMLKVFDEISCKPPNRYASDLFKIDDWDKLSNYQLTVIKDICQESYPNVAKSCAYIIENGC